ncbi:folylpolyglutamate Synthase [Clostridium sp. CAG:448]|nr:folylpolyglutamate Synthase [Clostridium sp. CAG:448]
MVMLNSCDFRTAQTAAAGNLNSSCAQPHGVANRHLHGTAEGNTLFQLAADILRNKLCVQIRLADLINIQGNGHTDHLLKICLELVDFAATVTDHHTRLSAVYKHAHSTAVPLDFDLRNTGCLKGILQVLSYIVVGHKSIAEHFVLNEPS